MLLTWRDIEKKKTIKMDFLGEMEQVNTMKWIVIITPVI